jgi:hypothetical protein
MSALDLPEPRPAVHESRCPECGSTIRAGELIVPPPGGEWGTVWRHANCPPGRFDITREVCSSCFTEKATNGACLCEES